MPLTEQEVRDALNDIIRSGVAPNPTAEELLGMTAPRGWGDVLDAPEINDEDDNDSFDIDFDEEQEEESQEDPEEAPRPSEEAGTRLVFNTGGLRGAFISGTDSDSPTISRTAVEWATAQAGTTRRNPYKKNVIKEDLKSKITIKGVEYDRSECVMLTDNLTWYLKTDPKLVIDILSGQYIHRERCYGVIESLEIVNKKPVYGKEVYVSKSSYETCPRIYSEIYSFDVHILYIDNIKGWEYSEDPERMMIVDYNPKYMEIKSSRNYDSYKNKSSLIAALKGNDGSSSQTYLITEGMKYTFGVEIEVNRGYLPQWMASRNFNLSCVRDGSINGGEGGPE